MMSEPHTFEYNGVIVEYYPATVRTTLAYSRLLGYLLSSFDCEDGAAMALKDPEEWQNMLQFAGAIAQAKVNTPVDWWVNSVSGVEKTRAAYEAMLGEGPTLWNLLYLANDATQPPKKTVVTTKETSTP
jgi:hypothetical protein